jgi:ubiquinone/menaquinone biosynthesis C-methylase UbiE
MTNSTQQGIANVEFRVANVYEIPFPDASFDAVLAHAVLQHLSEPEQALQEMHRVLKPGGIIGVREEDRDGDVIYPLPPRLKQAHELLMRLWSQAGGDPYFPKRYRAILREAGFAHIRMTATCKVRSDSASSAMWANALVHFLRQEPTLAERAIELGWADRVTLAELVDALQDWGAHPNAFWSETWCAAVVWKK